jgi:hypothetical protein
MQKIVGKYKMSDSDLEGVLLPQSASSSPVAALDMTTPWNKRTNH